MTMITPSAQLTLTKGNKSWSSTAVAAALELVDPLALDLGCHSLRPLFFFFFFFFIGKGLKPYPGLITVPFTHGAKSTEIALCIASCWVSGFCCFCAVIGVSSPKSASPVARVTPHT
eukprot:FR737527.1.p3 GENE.FR737527.1~~FR737527.1.p3  ORF type:complete len:117 (-),score=23.44 FR737527.1:284-634(-)